MRFGVLWPVLVLCSTRKTQTKWCKCSSGPPSSSETEGQGIWGEAGKPELFQCREEMALEYYCLQKFNECTEKKKAYSFWKCWAADTNCNTESSNGIVGYNFFPMMRVIKHWKNMPRDCGISIAGNVQKPTIQGDPEKPDLVGLLAGKPSKKRESGLCFCCGIFHSQFNVFCPSLLYRAKNCSLRGLNRKRVIWGFFFPTVAFWLFALMKKSQWLC